jgi:hypothetical protein
MMGDRIEDENEADDRENEYDLNDPFIDDEALEGEEDGEDEDGDTLMNTP